MIKKLKLFVAAAIVSVGLGALSLSPVSAAPCTSAASCVNDGLTATGGTGSKSVKVSDIIETIVKVLLFIIGAVSVIMIIIGGFRYVVSQGDSSAVSSAKNTILYAVIGLLVAIFAYAIVNFVVSQFVK